MSDWQETLLPCKSDILCVGGPTVLTAISVGVLDL